MYSVKFMIVGYADNPVWRTYDSFREAKVRASADVEHNDAVYEAKIFLKRTGRCLRKYTKN